MKNDYAPVVIFVYARLEHTKATVEALAKNKLAQETDLYIFSDGAKDEKTKDKVDKIRKYIYGLEKKRYFKSITINKSEINKGLANSIIMGVNEIIKKYDRVIVLEDDLVTSTEFLTYMNEALDLYENDNRIWSISGYNVPMKVDKYIHDVYLNYRGCSWGWGTWKNRWEKVDWDVKDYKNFKNNIIKRNRFNRGGNDMSMMLDNQMRNSGHNSWAIRWCYQEYKEKMYTIYPVKSLIRNIGLDGTGVHSKKDNKFDTIISNKKVKLEKNIKFNKKMMKLFKSKFNNGMHQQIKELLSAFGLYDIIINNRRKK